MMLAAIAALAIVTQDQAALRAAPKDSAAQQAVLWQGDTLEIRGERLDYLQVYDHRRERAGFVRSSQVRQVDTQPADAPALLSVVRFLRETPGAETLGIAYTAAYLKAAPAGAINAEPFAALGSFADRLARQATSRQAKANDAVLAAHLEVAASYGVNLQSFERDGRIQLCYDGEAFRRVMALAGTATEHADAALALTRDDCIDPALPQLARHQLDQWRAEVLDRVPTDTLPAYLKNRLLLRRASVTASLAFQAARHGETTVGLAAQSIAALAGVNKTELTDEDLGSYNDAAIRVGASRWGLVPAATTRPGLGIVTSPGQPGETCVSLVDAHHDAKAPLISRCTYGVAWVASAAPNPQGSALALAVQPLESWRELWVFRRIGEQWTVDVLTPNTHDTTLGYIEFAGWVPGGGQLLTTTETRTEGRYKRTFTVLNADSLNVDKQADRPESINAFYRWQDAAWKRETVSLR